VGDRFRLKIYFVAGAAMGITLWQSDRKSVSGQADPFLPSEFFAEGEGCCDIT
jgi:hypothetical protein